MPSQRMSMPVSDNDNACRHTLQNRVPGALRKAEAPEYSHHLRPRTAAGFHNKAPESP
jgi:hypothetical protein